MLTFVFQLDHLKLAPYFVYCFKEQVGERIEDKAALVQCFGKKLSEEECWELHHYFVEIYRLDKVAEAKLLFSLIDTVSDDTLADIKAFYAERSLDMQECIQDLMPDVIFEETKHCIIS